MAAGGNVSATQHRAALAASAAGVRAAGGWLSLPHVAALRGAPLEAALRHGVAGVLSASRALTAPLSPGCTARVEDAGAVSALEADLAALALLRVDAELLGASGAGRAIKALRQHSNPRIAAASAAVVAAWRQTVS